LVCALFSFDLSFDAGVADSNLHSIRSRIKIS
jgi:hypothetical protein